MSLAAQEIAVEVRLFAMLRERAGAGDRASSRLPAGATVADALARLGEHGRRSASCSTRLPVPMAVNREYARRRDGASTPATSWR